VAVHAVVENQDFGQVAPHMRMISPCMIPMINPVIVLFLH
jgi:hypothetical protein